jgi:hypothetical protein
MRKNISRIGDVLCIPYSLGKYLPC